MSTYAVLGALQREYVLPYEGQPMLDIPGGEALYAAVGVALWEQRPGLINRIPPTFPQAWLDELAARGWDVQGVRRLSERWEDRRICAPQARVTALAPLFARYGLTVPLSLLDYQPPPPGLDPKRRARPWTLRMTDLPGWLAEEARIAVFTPYDFLTHFLIPAEVRRRGARHVLLMAGSGYMHPAFRAEMPSLLLDITAFFLTATQARALFAGWTDDLRDIVQLLGQWGAHTVVIFEPEGAHVAAPREDRAWFVPFYPTRRRNPCGREAAFVGGFAVGYLQHYDPLRAALYGAVAASFVQETLGALQALDPLPELRTARFEQMASLVQRRA
ncbi:MAG: hypothetical protein GXO36_06640 [Chloroflexi bacterium]|nr:hypothetical protein [Chloroflexota bacterium]